MSELIHYKGCSWIIAWDASAQDHRYIRGGDLVFCEDEILYVGSHIRESRTALSMAVF